MNLPTNIFDVKWLKKSFSSLFKNDKSYNYNLRITERVCVPACGEWGTKGSGGVPLLGEWLENTNSSLVRGHIVPLFSPPVGQQRLSLVSAGQTIRPAAKPLACSHAPLSTEEVNEKKNVQEET